MSEDIILRILNRINDFHRDHIEPVWIELGVGSFNDLLEDASGSGSFCSRLDREKVITVFSYEVRENHNLPYHAIEPVLPQGFPT